MKAFLSADSVCPDVSQSALTSLNLPRRPPRRPSPGPERPSIRPSIRPGVPRSAPPIRPGVPRSVPQSAPAPPDPQLNSRSKMRSEVTPQWDPGTAESRSSRKLFWTLDSRDCEEPLRYSENGNPDETESASFHTSAHPLGSGRIGSIGSNRTSSGSSWCVARGRVERGAQQRRGSGLRIRAD